ncbi:hypothetical protein ACLOJK_039790 [Asimina triloba]
MCLTRGGANVVVGVDLSQTGQIDKSVRLHVLGQSIGRPPEGRFRIICLEDLMKEMAVRFPVSSGNLSPPGNINETAENLKLMNWEKVRISEEIKREEELLNIAKTSFDLKKHALVRKVSKKTTNKQLKDVPVNDAKDGSFVRKRMHLFVECHTVSIMFMAFFNE